MSLPFAQIVLSPGETTASSPSLDHARLDMSMRDWLTVTGGRPALKSSSGSPSALSLQPSAHAAITVPVGSYDASVTHSTLEVCHRDRRKDDSCDYRAKSSHGR